jgi:hypothetical protein
MKVLDMAIVGAWISAVLLIGSLAAKYSIN